MNTSPSTPNTEPDNHNQTAIALVAAFDDHERLLLLKRKDDQHCAGLWSFPGGKVEANETAGQAAQRELHEETGLTCTDWQQLGTHHFDYEDRRLHFILFRCRCTDTTALQPESKHDWVTLHQLPTLPMPPANVALIDMLQALRTETPQKNTGT